MDRLHIKGTPQTPEIVFDFDKHYFILSGRSTPDDCDIYYFPVIRSLEKYNLMISKIPEIKEIKFDFYLIYYNTISIRYLNTVMGHIEKISEHKNVVVNWKYESDDEYLLEMGEYFKDSYNITNFNLIEIKIENKKRKKYN